MYVGGGVGGWGGEQNTEKHAVNNPDHTLHHLISNRLIVLPQLQEIFSTRAITL